jgi:hypothetical protein
VGFLGDTLFISAEFGVGSTAFTGVVYSAKNLSQYIFDKHKKEDYNSHSYSRNYYESSATKTVGIINLIFKPILAINLIFILILKKTKKLGIKC